MTDDSETPPRQPDNPFDAWLASAPATPAAGVCPWCSALLEPPDAADCPSCGAHLASDDGDPIPGLTVVDPDAGRKARAVNVSGGTGVLAWLTGDRDLVDAAAQGPAPAVGGPAAVTGTASRDAVAPPDRRLRREMARIGREERDEEGTADADAAAPEATAEAPEADGAASAGDPAADAPGPDAPG